MRAIRIGVTGKLGSGKSLLVKAMEARGIYCVRSDNLARDLMETDPELRTRLAEILGPEVYHEGWLNRKFIASQIFNNRELRRKVEAAVHPATTAEIREIFQNNPGKLVVVESALILQSKFREMFDYIVLVESPDEAAIDRVVAEGRMSRADAEARLAEQNQDATDPGEADFVLDNSGTREEFEKKCLTIIGILETLKDRELPKRPLHSLAPVSES